jgi:hypothetical protein
VGVWDGETAGVSEGDTLGVVRPGWLDWAIAALASVREAAMLSSLNMRDSFA